MLTDSLPTSWNSITFGELLKKKDVIIQNGFACGKNNQVGIGVPQLRPMNITSQGQISLESLKFCESENDIRRYLLKAGDVIFNNTNSAELVGKTAVWDNTSGSFVLSNHMTIIRLSGASGLYPPFLAKYLHSLWGKRYFEQICTNHINQSSVGIDRLKRIDIPLPPLDTQRKIVAILEKAEATQRLRAEADALMQDLVQSVFLDMFGDPERNLFGWQEMDLSDVVGESLQNGLYKPSTEYGEGTPILRIDSFYEGKITDIESLKRLRCSSIEIEKYGIDVGDILINRVNSLDFLGKCGLVEYLPEPTVYESNMMRLRLNNAVANPFYVTSMLCTSYVKSQIISRAKKAVNQASINQDDVLSLKILVPPIGIQKEYENRVRGIEGVQRLHKKSQIQQETLMKSLQSKAFTGELIA